MVNGISYAIYKDCCKCEFCEPTGLSFTSYMETIVYVEQNNDIFQENCPKCQNKLALTIVTRIMLRPS